MSKSGQNFNRLGAISSRVLSCRYGDFNI